MEYSTSLLLSFSILLNLLNVYVLDVSIEVSIVYDLYSELHISHHVRLHLDCVPLARSYLYHNTLIVKIDVKIYLWQTLILLLYIELNFMSGNTLFKASSNLSSD